MNFKYKSTKCLAVLHFCDCDNHTFDKLEIKVVMFSIILKYVFVFVWTLVFVMILCSPLKFILNFMLPIFLYSDHCSDFLAVVLSPAGCS